MHSGGESREGLTTLTTEQKSGLHFADGACCTWLLLGRLLLLWLPATAERAVKLNQTLVLVTTCLGERKFRSEERTLAVEDFQERRGASGVAEIGEANRFLQVGDSVFLPYANFM